MLFSEIVGQEELKAHLVRSVNENRVSHAQLFFGEEGRGKLALSIAYAQYISCTDKKENDSCGICPSCAKYTKLAHPDLHFIFPTSTVKSKKASSANFMNSWREFLIENKSYVTLNEWYKHIEIENKQGIISAEDCNDIIHKLSLKAYEGDFKVLILWMADKMFHSAAPKILKALEEPPPKTLFILITENPDRLLKTILSRTQRVYVPPIEKNELIEYLSAHSHANNLEIEEAVKTSKGSIKTAQNVLEDIDNQSEYLDLYMELMRMTYAYKVPEILNVTSQLASKGREWQKQFLSFCINASQKAFYFSENQSDLVQVSKEEGDFYSKISKFVNTQKIDGFQKIFEEGLFHISRNGNARIIFTDLALQLSRWFKK